MAPALFSACLLGHLSEEEACGCLRAFLAAKLSEALAIVTRMRVALDDKNTRIHGPGRSGTHTPVPAGVDEPGETRAMFQGLDMAIVLICQRACQDEDKLVIDFGCGC